MSQVIEVRLISPAHPEVLCDEFTQASSHREAIELALSTWSGGVGVIKRMELDRPGRWTPDGPCWKYIYTCVLEDPDDKDGVGRELMAVLFAEYKEKEEKEERKK